MMKIFCTYLYAEVRDTVAVLHAQKSITKVGILLSTSFSVLFLICFFVVILDLQYLFLFVISYKCVPMSYWIFVTSFWWLVLLWWKPIFGSLIDLHILLYCDWWTKWVIHAHSEKETSKPTEEIETIWPRFPLRVPSWVECSSEAESCSRL